MVETKLTDEQFEELCRRTEAAIQAASPKNITIVIEKLVGTQCTAPMDITRMKEAFRTGMMEAVKDAVKRAEVSIQIQSDEEKTFNPPIPASYFEETFGVKL